MPIVFMLAGFKDIAEMIGRPQLMINSGRYQFITQLLGFLPFSIVTVATGAIVIGDAPHFNTPHKVGLLHFLTRRIFPLMLSI